MKALVIYDSEFGNTEQVAHAISGALEPDARLMRALEARQGDLNGIDLLVVGSPTQGGRPTAAVKAFIDAIAPSGLDGIDVAAFDTRIAAEDQALPLRMLMKLIGFAAPRIATALERKGARLVLAPEGFIVEGKEGPLRKGEIERATIWGRGVLAART